MDNTQVVRWEPGLGQVYIGRPSQWGNPFRIGPDGDREQVIERFEAWMRSSPDAGARRIRRDVHLLHGKVLGCFCAPEACHGEVLARWAKVKFDERCGGAS